MAEGEREVVELPPILQALLELVARFLRMERGTWRLEVLFSEGRYDRAFFHRERIPGGVLREFEHPPPA